MMLIVTLFLLCLGVLTSLSMYDRLGYQYQEIQVQLKKKEVGL